MDTIAYRLKDFIASTGLTDSEFADKANISRSTLSLFLSGKNKKINDVLLTSIHRAFPELSISWLLFDDGEKMISHQKFPNEDKKSDPAASTSAFPDNNVVESEKFMDYGKNIFENDKEIELKSPSYETLLAEIENLKYILRASVSLMQKKFEGEENKKIAQITVYYADNTFEIFVPSSAGSK